MIRANSKRYNLVNLAGAAVILFFFADLSAQDAPEPGISRPKVQYAASALRDPFSEYKSEEPVALEDKQKKEAATPPSLTVQGIIWGGKFPQAIINDRAVKEGDSLEGARIVRIEKQGVNILYYGTLYTLSSPAKMTLDELEGNEEDCPECKKRRQRR
ncbi:hypothetical protein ACFLZ3_00120 [Candidatus Omnitrophota bacterium]